MTFTLVAPIPLTETTTVLPNPNFGDQEGATGELNILRTVKGRRRTYVISKDRRKLRWDFTLSRNKAIELFEFYRSYNAERSTYSSGMAMRLAFAISKTVDADIILMDEWLNVGDDRFSHRAQERLKGLLDRAKILVLASHNLDLIRKNCNKVIRLEHGKITSIESADSLQAWNTADKRAETG